MSVGGSRVPHDDIAEILIDGEGAAERARDLRHLQTVGQPGTVVVAFRCNEDLRFVLETAEWFGVHNPVAVTLKIAARR